MQFSVMVFFKWFILGSTGLTWTYRRPYTHTRWQLWDETSNREIFIAYIHELYAVNTEVNTSASSMDGRFLSDSLLAHLFYFYFF